eukprot:3011743-Pleurochrysis_carterae.AAC.1
MTAYNKATDEKHTCAYCGKLTKKYCQTCAELGRGKLGVCGRRSGRNCSDKHASGAPVKHASWNKALAQAS